MQVLKLDITGMPVAWLPFEEAACVYVRGDVRWTIGEIMATLHGGIDRDGNRSTLDLHPIVAVDGRLAPEVYESFVPPLSRGAIYRRDRGLCLYCGTTVTERAMTLDHVQPESRGGRNRYENLVCACRGCNHRKGNRTPEEARMPLLALPFTPNLAEHLILSGRHILADQMQFLIARAGANSRLAA